MWWCNRVTFSLTEPSFSISHHDDIYIILIHVSSQFWQDGACDKRQQNKRSEKLH